MSFGYSLTRTRVSAVMASHVEPTNSTHCLGLWRQLAHVLSRHEEHGVLSPCFRSGETQSRRGTHSSDSVHLANPEECGAGVTHPDTAHEMRIPLRPLRMSKPYRRLRKSRLREESVTALLEMSVPTVSPSSET